MKLFTKIKKRLIMLSVCIYKCILISDAQAIACQPLTDAVLAPQAKEE